MKNCEYMKMKIEVIGMQIKSQVKRGSVRCVGLTVVTGQGKHRLGVFKRALDHGAKEASSISEILAEYELSHPNAWDEENLMNTYNDIIPQWFGNDIRDGGTVVVIDPECHLHGEDQNHIAELIVIFIKEHSAKVLLTSQSPNLVMAIDAYMRKYDIERKTNFYMTADDVTYKDVNDDLGQIYSDFTDPFSYVKCLRDYYLDMEGDYE